MTFAHVYNEIQKWRHYKWKHKSYIIKKRSNNKVSFVEFIFNSRQFKLMTTGSQPHGTRLPRFNCVQMIEIMSCNDCNVSPQDTLNCTSALSEHSVDWTHTSQTTSLTRDCCTNHVVQLASLGMLSVVQLPQFVTISPLTFVSLTH